jgi:hypothetical protein
VRHCGSQHWRIRNASNIGVAQYQIRQADHQPSLRSGDDENQPRLLLAKTMGFLKLGKISLDGSKVQANASKHSALSWGHATDLEEQLKAEVARLMTMAEAADAEEPEGMDIPAELARREDRLAAIAAAKAKIEARAAERHAAEQAEDEARRAKREAAKAEGKAPRGPDPKPPESGVGDKDQINLTDEDSRIMPAGGNNFEQAYNVQVGVDCESMLS